MKYIDKETWPRTEIFNFFSKVSNPFYSVTFQVDVTDLYNYCKKYKQSFYYAMIYVVTSSLNKVENFRYSIRNDKLCLLDKRNPSFTCLDKETELFKIVNVELEGTIIEFCKSCEEAVERQKKFINLEEETDELFYVSCLPWLELTGFTDEMDVLHPKFRDDGITRVSWGKYIEENGRKKLGLALSVNHRFIDGIHVGKFANELEKTMESL